MTAFSTRTDIKLLHLDDYLPAIVDRIASFEANCEKTEQGLVFTLTNGTAAFVMQPRKLSIEITSPSQEGLGRIREIIAGAIVLYAKAEAPEIVWTGDLANDSALPSFRLMTVTSVEDIAPHMRRIRLSGPDLERFQSLRGLHLRLLLPTEDITSPVWPIAGANGLVFWPDEARKPVARVYTVRRLDVAAGWMDVDFVLHDHGDDHEGDAGGVGARWAQNAVMGDQVGILGPLGRPVRDADWYVMGCDETGLPALSRIVEAMPHNTRGLAFIEVDDEDSRIEISHPPGMEIRWIYRNDPTDTLPSSICKVEWPEGSTFGWFAGEASQAEQVRSHWRGTLGLGRDQTLAATYWKRGSTGMMAG